MDRPKTILQIAVVFAVSVIFISAMMVLVFGLIYLQVVDRGKHPAIDMILFSDAIALSILGTFIMLGNFYVTFLRYPLFRWRGGEPQELKHVSLIMIVGTIFLGNAAWVFHWSNQSTLMWTAIIIALLDLGGPQWFILWVSLARIRK